MVLPYAVSRAATRTQGLRAWMVAAPVDVAALLFPLLFTDRYWRGTLFAAGLTVAIFAAGGLYRPRRQVSVLDELPSLCGRLLASAGIVAIIAAMRHDSVDYVTGMMRWLACSAALVIVGRAITRTMVVIARRRRWVSHNALVVGSGPVAAELGRLLRRNPRYGLRFVGCVDDPPAAGEPSEAGGPPLVGTLAGIEQAIEMVEADVLVVAEPRCSEAELMELLRSPVCAACDLWMVPLLWGSRLQGRVPDHIGAIPVVHIRHTVFGGPRWVLKRASDVVVASLALLVLSPVFALCAIATRLTLGRGIFFRQERIGRYGKPFQLIKFRTLRVAAGDAATDGDTRWSVANDDRVGPVGRFLRRTSLDELPQFWNILRGDMTVVGPRPERPYFVEKFSAELPEYAMRHRVPVGLTGLAQVSGLRGDTPISDRARFDNYYIENWSLWLDVKVVLRTIAEVLRGGGR
ncbi:sugar transferase [Catenuloplanes indicus]|uniref:Exopolysaccharide biosynthesis polyprenyl glycosylphosphotransferase n=1 Tax=Catenuloplanes indicus TaxID=137267 RepID=A0AAE3VTE5_9ACTN|nr:sugar transferase [Catenuloplanes indicus]MDQ0363958.1 exopolysaccharide biosynthesis polyprenyl glycosylphosphotransferase [Catenuloplanes indicus]